jgi:hypothetical protein
MSTGGSVPEQLIGRVGLAGPHSFLEQSTGKECGRTIVYLFAATAAVTARRIPATGVGGRSLS